MLKSGLGRPVVWSFPSNRFAVLGSAAGSVLIAGVRLLSDRPVTVGNLFATFGALFLAWAVARELDPDEPSSATVALAIAALAVLQFGFASLRIVLGVLLGVRLMVGTVGTRVRAGDVVVLVGLAAYLGYRDAAWIVIAVMALGAWLAGGPHRRAFGLMVVASGAAGIAFSEAGAGFTAPGFDTWMVLAGVVAATFIVATGPGPRSLTDVGNRPLRKDRLITGRVAAAVAVVVVSLQTGLAAAAGPVASGLLGAAVVRLVRGVSSHRMTGGAP